MPLKNTILIAVTEISKEIECTTPLKRRLQKAMELSLNHWVLRDMDDKFDAAIASVLESLPDDDPDKNLLIQELEFLKKMNNQLETGKIDQSLFDNIPTVIGIIPLWTEAKKSAGIQR